MPRISTAHAVAADDDGRFLEAFARERNAPKGQAARKPAIVSAAADISERSPAVSDPTVASPRAAANGQRPNSLPQALP